MAYPHLPNAPITEAVLDFRVRLAPHFDVARFRALATTLPDYPIQEDRLEAEFSAQFGAAHATQAVAQPPRITARVHKSTDGRRIAQFGLEGFSFHRLEPYSRWSVIYSEAMRLWEIYQTIAQPVEIVRLGVRYINQLRLPLPCPRLEEYLTAPPVLPPGVSAEIDGFLVRMVLKDPSSRMAANLTLATGKADNNKLPIILDVDAYQTRNLSADSASLSANFEGLRELKNRIFFRSITPKTEAMFK